MEATREQTTRPVMTRIEARSEAVSAHAGWVEYIDRSEGCESADRDIDGVSLYVSQHTAPGVCHGEWHWNASSTGASLYGIAGSEAQAREHAETMASDVVAMLAKIAALSGGAL